MGQPSPYFIRPLNSDLGAIDAEFSSFEEETEPWIKLHEYWRVFRKRLKLVLGVALAIVALVVVRDLEMTRLYTATTTLLIGNRTPHLFSEDTSGSASAESDSRDFSSDDQTEYELLRSRSIAARVVASEGKLKPQVDPARPRFGVEIRKWVIRELKPVLPTQLGVLEKWLLPTNSRPTTDDAAWAKQRERNAVPSAAIDAYLEKVRIVPIENTHMARVRVTTTDPGLSARLANAHAHQFIRRGIELNSQASEEAERFLSDKLADLKLQVEQSEVALNNYRRDKGIIPGLISVNGKQDVVLERLNRINQDLQEAHLKTISLGTEVALIKEKRADALPAVIQSDLIQDLKGQLDKLQVENAGLAGQFKPSYPSMQELRARIQGTRDALSQEIQNAVSSVRQEYQAAQDREHTLSVELEKQKAFAMGLNDAAVRYLILEREADTNRDLYNSVLKRMKDMALLADVHASNISVVDEAEPPRWPSSPKMSQDILLASTFGLALALGLAFGLEYLDATLKFPDEAQRYLRVPSLAVIPEFSFALGSSYGGKSQRNGRALEVQHYQNGSRHAADIVTTFGKYSIISESYRTLRTALLLSRAGTHPKITLITSALPHEGKTTVAVNTAIVLAQTGAKVILVDADLRKPRCHKVLALKNHFGLVEVLTGSADDEAISKTSIEHLDLLSSGKIPPSPSELLGSNRMREILESLSKVYDYVVVDSPPAMVVADSIALSAMVDGVVLVAAGGQTPKQQAKAAIARLQQANARVFGFVLNKVRIHKFDYPYYHYSGFYQGYDMEETEPEEDETEEDFSVRLQT